MIQASYLEETRNRIIRKLTSNDIEVAGCVIAASMMVEPGYAAALPDEDLRWRVLVPLITDSVREAVSHGTAFGVFDDDRLLGASLWLPPGAYPPVPRAENDGPVVHPPYLSALEPDILAGLVAYDENCIAHFPDEPAWYLMYLGVEPAGQGNGIGTALMQKSIENVLERQPAPLYLETGTERNVRFYQRFGFTVREAKVQLAPGDTLHWTMLRPEPDAATG